MKHKHLHVDTFIPKAMSVMLIARMPKAAPSFHWAHLSEGISHHVAHTNIQVNNLLN